MTTKTDAMMARLDQVLEQLEALGLTGPPPVATPAAVNPDGTPGNVAAGELIESAWGNATSNSITALKARLDGSKLRSGGGSFTTDGSGYAAVPFNYTYGQPPIVTYSVEAPVTVDPIYTQLYSRTTTFFVVKFHYGAGAGIGNPYIGKTVNVFWIAMQAVAL